MRVKESREERVDSKEKREKREKGQNRERERRREEKRREEKKRKGKAHRRAHTHILRFRGCKVSIPMESDVLTASGLALTISS